LSPLPSCQAVIAAVAHKEFKTIDLSALAKVTGQHAPFLDVKGFFDRTILVRHGFTVWRL
jgi:UDP-N-acetyl-D-galactosamine dehydrogenase